MDIIINGQTHTTEAGATLAQLIDQLDLAGKRIAIEVNQEIIPRSTFDTFTFTEGDKIEIVGAIGGG